MSATVRLDKWLWYARFVKTRALAQKLIERGQVSVNGALVHKAGVTVGAGDQVSVVLGPIRRTVSVLATGERRGPADEARTLYAETTPAERLGWEEAGLPLHRPVGPPRRAS